MGLALDTGYVGIWIAFILPAIAAVVCIIIACVSPASVNKIRRHRKNLLRTIEDSETVDIQPARVAIQRQVKSVIFKDPGVNRTLVIPVSGGISPSLGDYESRETRKAELKAIRKEIKMLRRTVEGIISAYGEGKTYSTSDESQAEPNAQSSTVTESNQQNSSKMPEKSTNSQKVSYESNKEGKESKTKQKTSVTNKEQKQSEQKSIKANKS